MNPRIFAMTGGIVMLAVAVFSLIWPGASAMLPRLEVETSYGLFAGLFAMNIFGKISLAILGLLGIAAAKTLGRELPMSILWSRVVFVVMGIGTILGMFPQTNTLFGYTPLFGNMVWFHLIFALFGAYYGFTLSLKVPADRTGKHPARESLAH